MLRLTSSFISFVCIALMVSSCTAHIDESMMLWEGRHFSHVLTTWGEPSAAYDDFVGGGLLIYHTRLRFAPPDTEAAEYGRSLTLHNDWHSYAGIRRQINPDGFTPDAPSYRVFYVDADGIVYGVDWKGY